MNTTKTLKLLSLALVSLPLLAQAGNADVSHDGWKSVGDSLVYVGTADAGTSRAAVRQAARSDTIAHDGFAQVGDSLVFVNPPAAQGKTRAAVRAELTTAQSQQVGSDGFAQVGDSLVYVGVPTAGGSTRVAAQ